jgi:NAD-dependent deacetylase
MSAEDLKLFVRSASAAVAFTGAGISTESGIPDFRSPGGVWSRHRMVYFDEFVESREARATYWKQRVEIYAGISAAKPNAGHLALSWLEAQGHLAGVVTQNIDGLHQLAGSKRVVELHGTARVVACIACGKEWEPDEVHGWVAAGNEAPDCDACGQPLKSRTISFGQSMPPVPMQEAAQLCRQADVMLAIGSSLVVEPAASFPRIAKQHGATLAIVNQTETPLDDLADIVIREPIGATLNALLS